MKRILIILSLVALVATTLAQSEGKKDWALSMTSTAISEYVGSTGGGTFSDKACWQTNITATHKSGIYADFCRSLPIDWKNSNSFANETDYTIGYNTNVIGGKYNVDLSVVLYDLVPSSDLYAFGVAVTANTGKIRPYIRAEYDAAQSSKLMPCMIYKVGVKGSVPKTPLDWNFWVLGRPYATSAETLSAANVQVSWSLPLGNGTLTPAVRYQRSFQSGGPTTDHQIFSVSYGASF